MVCGPTGVGKTELARALAELIFGDETALNIFDMGEYGESHTRQRLIGAPPSYVGYDQGGELTGRCQNGHSASSYSMRSKRPTRPCSTSSQHHRRGKTHGQQRTDCIFLQVVHYLHQQRGRIDLGRHQEHRAGRPSDLRGSP